MARVQVGIVGLETVSDHLGEVHYTSAGFAGDDQVLDAGWDDDDAGWGDSDIGDGASAVEIAAAVSVAALVYDSKLVSFPSFPSFPF